MKYGLIVFKPFCILKYLPVETKQKKEPEASPGFFTSDIFYLVTFAAAEARPVQSGPRQTSAFRPWSPEFAAAEARPGTNVPGCQTDRVAPVQSGPLKPA